jgi:Fe-S-cluster-containing dehydrogenase component/anaerobic selenocysteine-containing dehydrogenase
MSDAQKHYWKDWQDREPGESIEDEGEFGPNSPETETSVNRRDFLLLAGFALAGTTAAGCRRASVQHALPLLVQPEGNVAGRSYQYASVCGGCSAGCGMLVKTRDGRPIKLEGNPEHPLSRGGLCAVGQASLLGLYDQHRLDAPQRDGKEVPWLQVDKAIRSKLQALRDKGRKGRAVRFLTGPVISPTTRLLIQRFLSTFPDARHVVLDPRGGSAILEAHARTHGIRALPHFHFDRADVVVSFDADFLGTWISPVEFTSAYQAGRRPQGNPPRMSYHVQFESRMSLTGSKADQRLCVRPGDIGLILSHLAARLAVRAEKPLPAERLEDPPVAGRFLDHLVEVLWQSRRRSLVVCGQQDVTVQVLCNFINHLLGNYGTTVDLAQPSYQLQAGEGEVEALLGELHADRVEALFVFQCNPVHDLPSSETLVKDLQRVPLLVSCSERPDETTRLAHFVCPVPHFLESWSDAEPIDGLVSLIQPTIAPLGNTRSLLESLTAWMPTPPAGRSPTAYDLLRTTWEAEVFPRRRKDDTFQAFWDQTLHDGFAQVEPLVRWRKNTNVPALAASSVGLMGSPLAQGSLLSAAARRPGDPLPFNSSAVRLVSQATPSPDGTFSVVLYAKVGMPDARHAYNPWLHELPDPISKVTWDNYACLSPAAAERLGLKDGDVVRLEAAEANGETRVLELPAFVQPGQHDQVVAVALGYGSVHSKRFVGIGPPWLEAKPTVGADGMVGQNAAPFLTWVSGSLRPIRDGVRLTRTRQVQALASTQSYHRLTMPPKLAPAGQESRAILQEATLAEFRQGLGRRSLPMAGPEKNLWPKDHASEGVHWGMVIDHNACTGCSACVIACQVENNIPVVGKDEVRRHRDMHWLRLDRYYADRGTGVDVAHQPMLCQHCGNAPCETVCPVLATVHSSEGLNQQVYNRCVGTRYCANNCPYKVRRFNWFDYAHDDNMENLALNPDVTVRSRGVMEKCTFCVQRIQESKAEASRQGLPVRDGEVQTACQQSCPAKAITFGNLNDSKSRVAQQAHGPRAYRVLDELNVRPSVSYLTLVRNRPVDLEGEANG